MYQPFSNIQSKTDAVFPPGKQHYLRLPKPDKNLCCSPKTNTLKVIRPNRYQSHTDLWQAHLTHWHVSRCGWLLTSQYLCRRLTRSHRADIEGDTAVFISLCCQQESGWLSHRSADQAAAGRLERSYWTTCPTVQVDVWQRSANNPQVKKAMKQTYSLCRLMLNER